MRFCIILGAAKAGTTSLFNYLAQHPEIAPCKNKEPNFFTKYYDKGCDWYLSLWDNDAVEKKMMLEGTVNHTNKASFPDSSGNMLDFHQKHSASMKFIYIMREPIERLESHYNYNYTHLINWSLETALKKGYIVEASCYAKQLDLYFEKFKPENFLLLDFDELKDEPENALRKTCEFLNINSEFVFSGLNKIHNKTTGKMVTRPIENLYRKYPALKSLAKLFPKILKRFIQNLFVREKITEKFRLTDAQRQRVHDALKNDMKHLHEKHGVDVSKWGF